MKTLIFIAIILSFSLESSAEELEPALPITDEEVYPEESSASKDELPVVKTESKPLEDGEENASELEIPDSSQKSSQKSAGKDVKTEAETEDNAETEAESDVKAEADVKTESKAESTVETKTKSEDSSKTESNNPPNIIVITADDLGVGDVGAYYGSEQVTPHLDQMAKNGLRFTQFSAAIADDIPAQRAIITGTRFSKKIDQFGLGLLAKSKQYKTGFIGQWLLENENTQENPFIDGDDCKKSGFDQFWGIRRSVDQWSFHPIAGEVFPPLPVYENNHIIGYNISPAAFSEQITRRAVDFIEQNKENPFFLFIAFTDIHVPLIDNMDKATCCSIKQLDKSIGSIIDRIDKCNISNRTLIIFLSDNGPNKAYQTQSGGSGPFREGKYTCFEGGVRIPCIMSYPGTIPPGQYNHVVSQLDIYPTMESVLNIDQSLLRKTEGKSLWNRLKGENRDKPIHNSFAYYSVQGKIIAVRAGDWKLYCPQSYKSVSQSEKTNRESPLPYEIKNIDWELYNLKSDPGEQTPCNDKHPEIIKIIRKAIGR